MDAESDTEPLSDVEYDDQPAESDAGGTPGGSLAAAGASSQKRTQTQDHTPPPPPKRQKKQVKGDPACQGQDSGPPTTGGLGGSVPPRRERSA
mgnify:CR=1 FL=1